MVTEETAKALLKQAGWTLSPRDRRMTHKRYFYAAKTIRKPRHTISRYIGTGDQLAAMSEDELRQKIRQFSAAK